ncbi:amino acid-binding ACT domain regulatory protein [Geotalea daltonii FRC-32]|uniref:Amino acid-binding ACT domain regulatory protein n=1 Tax=Geotalea daltonii (strain DSM 22248 / JCM 15807 / FRC-32) TaxID=316067 RepID=B9M7N4_GEODF|nr:ACT domain-containing protein [Geotalea daltonii]ACM22140.1 amino acid-binding ACT domain regulatory protein [Geotalea daltonii FRC-32]
MNDCRKDNLAHFAVTVISKDRPGIVADISEVLYRLGCNLEDSSCTMLGGDFAIILIVSHEKPFTRARLSDEFRSHFDRTGLHVHVRTLHDDEVCPVKEEGELCLVSVYGSDQPGIVYRVTRELADRKVNITDLNTRLIGTKEEPVYVLMLEAILPPGMSVENVEQLLEKLKKELNVEIKVRVITPVSL